MTVLLSGQGLTKSYGFRPLFTDLTVDPPAALVAARRADQPPRPAAHRLARTAAAGLAVRVRGGHARPSLPAGRRRRNHRNQPRLSRRLLPRARLLRRLRCPPRAISGGP